MRNLLTIIIVLGSIITSVAQNTYTKDSYKILHSMDFFNTYKASKGELRTVLEENDIEGTPYLDDNFVNGTIYTTTQQKYVDIPIRLNAYNDEIEFKNEAGEIQALANPDILEAVDYGEYILEYIPYSVGKKTKNGFLILLYEDEVSLYAKPEILFKRAEEPNAYDNAKPAEFVRRPDSYFVKIGMEPAVEVGSKKELLQVFPNHQKEVSQYIKKNKVKTSGPDKLIDLVEYYNAL